MSEVLQGFAVIAVLVAVGSALAHLGVLGEDGQLMLSRLVYYVATPCLLVYLLSTADTGHVLGAGLVVAAVSALAVTLAYAVVARVRGYSLSHTVVGSLASAYANAGYLGLPIAAYVLGDATFALPVMVLQLVVYAPIALALLDVAVQGRRPRVTALLGAAVRNPVTVAAVVGVALSVTGWHLPFVVSEPTRLLGQMAVPAALLAFGVSLRLGGLRLGSAREVGVIAVLKLACQPLVAYLTARVVLGLAPHEVLGVTMMAALPTAQNVFVYANRFGRSTTLARDAIAVTTVLSVPVVLGIAAWLT